jgi:dTDP-4-dehydrorhamnose 3,5-epimerase
MTYLCSETSSPTVEHGLHPLDPALGIEWPVTELLVSERDAAAPTLAHAMQRGMLPDYGVCRDFTRSLRTG